MVPDLSKVMQESVANDRAGRDAMMELRPATPRCLRLADFFRPDERVCALKNR